MENWLAFLLGYMYETPVDAIRTVPHYCTSQSRHFGRLGAGHIGSTPPSQQRDHYLDLIVGLATSVPPPQNPTPEYDWTATCQQHGFSAFKQPRSVYDLALFAIELDWREVRLHTHSPYVDYLVIVEYPTTFTNRPKPLLLKESWERCKDSHHKTIKGSLMIHSPALVNGTTRVGFAMPFSLKSFQT